jgi:hypothetical protein
MGRYIVLYEAPLGVAERFAQATPEEARKGMQLWVDWGQKIGAGLVDPGKPLGNAQRVTPSGVAKTDSNIIGMSILQAESMELFSRNGQYLKWKSRLGDSPPSPSRHSPPGPSADEQRSERCTQ